MEANNNEGEPTYGYININQWKYTHFTQDDRFTTCFSHPCTFGYFVTTLQKTLYFSSLI